MPRSRPSIPDWPVRWLRPAVLGLAGSVALCLLVTLTLGVFYIWLMTGLAPHVQIREGGVGIAVAWLLGGLFAGMHLAGIFFLERSGPWGIAGITLCLLVLWILAVRRRRVLRAVLGAHGVRDERGRS